MPPRKKKPGGSAGGSILGALGGGKKKEAKSSRGTVLKVTGGLVNSLGWLWKDRKPIRINELASAADNDDDEDEEETIVRSLPAFIVIDITAPGSGSEFNKTFEKPHYAKFDVSSGMSIGEFRVRLRDFFSEWQELKPPQKKAEKASKEKEEVKLKVPEPQRCATGRRAWGDGVRLGHIVSNLGGGGDWRAGDGEQHNHRLPWHGFGTELFRYGPVVVVLGSATLQEPDLDALDAEKAATLEAEQAAVAANMDDGDGVSLASTNSMAKAPPKTKKTAPIAAPRHLGVRSAVAWGGTGGASRLVPEKHPDNVAIRPLQQRGQNSINRGGEARSRKVSPHLVPTGLSNKMRPAMGLDNAREDLRDQGLGLRALGEDNGQ